MSEGVNTAEVEVRIIFMPGLVLSPPGALNLPWFSRTPESCSITFLSPYSHPKYKNALLRVSSLKVTELRGLLGMLNQRKTGRREDLLFRIQSYIREVALSIPFSSYKWAELIRAISSLCAASGRSALLTATRLSKTRASSASRVRHIFLQNTLQHGIPPQVARNNQGYNPRIVLTGECQDNIIQQELNLDQLNFAESILWKFSYRIGKPSLWDYKGGQGFFTSAILVSKSILQCLSAGGGCVNRLLCFVGPYDSYLKGEQINIEYPTGCELVMYCERMNIRKYFGIKGKPWSAQPIDISSFLNKKVGKHEVRLLVKNAPPKKYVVDFQIVNNVPIAALVKEIEETRFVDKSIILSENRTVDTEDDVIQTVEKVPLTDPTTFQRITVPCKDPGCSHAQCFDCATFLELNKSIPTWSCPICNKRVDPKNIYVDGLFAEILMLTSTSVKIVELHRNGDWTVPKDGKMSSNASDNQGDFDGSSAFIKVKIHTASMDPSGFVDNSESSPSNLHTQLGGGSEVPDVVFVDLTISDNEGEQPDQPAHVVSNTSQSDMQRMGVHEPSSMDMHSASPILPGARRVSESNRCPPYTTDSLTDNLEINSPSEQASTPPTNEDKALSPDIQTLLPLLLAGRDLPGMQANTSEDLTSNQHKSDHPDTDTPNQQPSAYINPNLRTIPHWNTPNEERHLPGVLPALLDEYWGEF